MYLMHSVYFSHHFCLIITHCYSFLTIFCIILLAPVLLLLVLLTLVLLALVLQALVLLALQLLAPVLLGMCYKHQCQKHIVNDTMVHFTVFTVQLAKCALSDMSIGHNGKVVCMLCPKISTSWEKLAPTGRHSRHVFATLVGRQFCPNKLREFFQLG